MVRSFCKQVHDPIIFSGLNHLVVNDNQVAYADISIGIIDLVRFELVVTVSC